ncbi:hypothetical protein BKA70DRAFT_1292624 [Coprinopsis sp. MPI-PUGE-AT-0042]|nr:hypothetical protein BKA70DRAFT_1292624 [Coprinopsis sp. MPI-PUGE-AT-0042]
MCVFLGLYIAWPSASRTLSWIQVIRQASIKRMEQDRRPRSYRHGLWCRFRALLVPVGASLPTVPQLEATPAFLGLAILLAINLVFIIDIESTLNLNATLQGQDEEDWGFGQILAILLLLLPLRDLLEAILARRLKQRQGELDEDLQQAIENKDLNGMKRAIERGSAFHTDQWSDHLKFWNLVSAHGSLKEFDNWRRTRMTIIEKALEVDLLYAVEARIKEGITAAYERGADLIAGALQSVGEISCYIVLEMEN